MKFLLILVVAVMLLTAQALNLGSISEVKLTPVVKGSLSSKVITSDDLWKPAFGGLPFGADPVVVFAVRRAG